MAGTASASQDGGEQAVMWPWKLCALTVKTTREVRYTNWICKTGENVLRNGDFTVIWQKYCCENHAHSLLALMPVKIHCSMLCVSAKPSKMLMTGKIGT